MKEKKTQDSVLGFNPVRRWEENTKFLKKEDGDEGGREDTEEHKHQVLRRRDSV